MPLRSPACIPSGSSDIFSGVEIHEDDNMLSLGMRLCETGAIMLLETMKSIEEGKALPVKQNPKVATKAPKITKNIISR